MPRRPRPALFLFCCCGVLLLCLQAYCRPALAEEYIDAFSSTVTVRKDGGMRVRERITVNAEGDKIKRGIYREIPLRYSGPAAYRGDVPITVITASMDGRSLDPVPTEYHGGFLRILMRGEAPLTPGRHTFELEYDTSLHLRFYEKNGELNWNVTGVWGFAINSVSCRIVLPQGVPVRRTVAWAGAAGSKKSGGLTVTRPRANEALFTGQDILLAPGEQCTVAVAFDIGAIADPVIPLVEQQRKEDALTEQARREEEARQEAEAQAIRAQGPFAALLYDNPHLPAQGLAFCVVFLYFFLLWRRLGVDPAKGVIVPRFYPPMAGPMGKDASADTAPRPLSPLAVDYLCNATRISGRGLAAAFLDLAFKGLCAIRKTDDGTFALEPRPLPEATAQTLPADERAVYDALVGHADNGRLTLRPHDESVRAVFTSAKTSLKSRFPAAWRLNAWVAVLGWFVVLPLAFAISFWGADISGYLSEDMNLPPPLPQFIISIFFCVALAAPLFCALEGTKKSYLIALVVGVFPVFGVFVLYSEGFFENLEWVLPVLMVATALAFTAVIKAPSKAARAALDEIEGLALYIRTAEKPRMEQLNGPEAAPEATPAVFRRLLPYALVLGLERTWCNRFAALLDAGALRDADIDADLTRSGWGDFSRGFGGAVAASAASQSSSSSESAFGSDGGGGAGSGSGGGGGGGL